MTAVAATPNSVCDLFREQIADHEQLQYAYAKLQREHDAALLLAKDSERALSERNTDLLRSSELVASLRLTLTQYIGALSLHGTFEDGSLTRHEREEAALAAEAATARQISLSQQLEAKTAEVDSMRGLADALSAARMRIAALETERDRAQGDARRSDHSCKEQEAQVHEYNKRCQVMREAMGRSEMDHQRAKDEMKQQLKLLTDKLRQEKALNKQLSTRVQELQGPSSAAAWQAAGVGASGGNAMSGLRPPPAGGTLLGSGRRDDGRNMFRPQHHGASSIFPARQQQQHQQHQQQHHHHHQPPTARPGHPFF